MTEPSGIAWCELFPTSVSVNDLLPDFAQKVSTFLDALQHAGAAVYVSATYRPPERAYLMHWAWKIANRNALPGNIPAMSGVDIDWTHDGDLEMAEAGAKDMVTGYGIAYAPALTSRHTQRLAIDMSIHWKGAIDVLDARDVSHACSTQEDLWPIGASYGVHKLASDPPHWSSDGH